MDVMPQSACLVVNPIIVYSYGFLFNCTTLGQASDTSTGYITQLFKTGDSSQPENFRDITITSNVGKLFNLILNSRLDKLLEENKLINKLQIGFTKNARTKDHMLVLKTLIDKFKNKSDDKRHSTLLSTQV